MYTVRQTRTQTHGFEKRGLQDGKKLKFSPFIKLCWDSPLLQFQVNNIGLITEKTNEFTKHYEN